LPVHAVVMSNRMTAVRLPRTRCVFMHACSAIEMPQLAPLPCPCVYRGIASRFLIEG
jgi:hypothetical protein